MEKLIVIEGRESYQYSNINDLIKNFINKDYFNMSVEERKNELEKKIMANTIQRNIKVVKLENNIKNFSHNAFVLYDEITYILSMLKFNIIILLERKDAEIFGKYINNENIKNNEDNYIILNKFADEIMTNYLKSQKTED